MRHTLTLTAGLAMLAGSLGEPARADDTPTTTPFQPQQFQFDRDMATDLGDLALDEWRMRRAEACLQVDELPSPGNRLEGFYAGLRAHIINAPLVNQLFHDISGSDTTICAGDVDIAGNGQPYYKADHDAAVLPIYSDPGYFLAASIEEMRHAWQDQQGMITTDDDQMSRQAYMAEIYLLEADGASFAVASAYQLREAGDPRAWDYMTRSPSYGPSAQAFATSLADAGVTADNPATSAQWQDAMRASFNAWFEETNLVDHYAEFNRNRITDRGQSTQLVSAEIAQLSERLEGLPGGERPDVYLGHDQVSQAVLAAFDRFPAPAPGVGVQPAATGPTRSPH